MCVRYVSPQNGMLAPSSDINPTYSPVSDIIWTVGFIKDVSRFPTKTKSEAFCYNLGTYKQLGNVFSSFQSPTARSMYCRHKSKVSAV